jgi:formate dehydrogenase major subunit
MAARLYATASPAMIINGLGVTEHVQGTDGVTALINLALLTGNIGKPGSGVNPLRGQNNVQGAAHMGCEPATLPGAIGLQAGRTGFERLWETPLPSHRGMHLLEMLSAARAGRLKALWAIGYDVLLTNPNAHETRKALAALELIVIQDLFMTETARELGSVFLPACSSFEKDGTFMNAERRIQRVRQVIPPAGASKPDWTIICALAEAMGHPRGFSFASAEEIWNEVRAGCDGARGITYERIEEAGLQWPCPIESHAGTPVLHVDRFASGARASVRAVEYHPTAEVTTPKYPFVLTTGRSLYEFNAGTMTGRCRTRELRPADLLEMSPDDAEMRGVADGDMVRLVSRYGSANIPVHLSSCVRPGELFATFHTAVVFLNTVTGGHVDRVVGSPEYKVTAVKVESV